MKLNIPAQAIKFVAPFRSANDIRWYLNGIYVRPMTPDEGSGVAIAGCNGHVLGIWRDDTDAVCERPAILRITPGLVSACRTNTDRRRVVISGNRLAVVETKPAAQMIMKGEKQPESHTTEVYVQAAIDWVPGVSKHEPWEMAGKHGDYPDIMRVIPEPTDNGASGKLNSVYVEAIAKAFREASGSMGRKWGIGVNMRQINADASVLVISEDLPQAVAILMPMRSNNYTGHTKEPTWLRRAKAASSRVAAAKAAPMPVHEPSDAGPPDGDGRGWAFVEGGAA